MPNEIENKYHNPAQPESLRSLFHRTFSIVLSLVLQMALVGCQMTDTKDGFLGFGKEHEFEVPDRILAIWADTILHQPGKAGVRGFGGRLYFYADGNSDPVKVDGGVTVYVFDGEKLDPGNRAPLKKYLITADQFSSHHSRTSLGHSYSIWVPWDQVGGPTRTLSLIVRFDGREGGTVLSAPMEKLLPGVSKESSKSTDIQQASFETTDFENDSRPAELHRKAKSSIGENPSGSGASSNEFLSRGHSLQEDLTAGSRERTTSHSIDLPPSFQRRLLNDRSLERSEETWERHGHSTNDVRIKTSIEAQSVGDPFEESADREFDATGSVQDYHSQRRFRSSQSRFPAQRVSRFPQGPAPLRKKPRPSESLSALPPTPRTGSLARTETISTTDSSNEDQDRPANDREPKNRY